MGGRKTAARPPIAVLAGLLALLAALAAPSAAADERGLSARLGGAMAGAGAWSGAYVYNADSGRPVLAWRHATPRILASNTKLFTTAAALAQFGVAGRLATEVRGTGTLGASGVYRGDLHLVGGGDPTFGSQRFAGRTYGSSATVEALAAQLDRDGVQRVAGRVLGDESAFDGLRGGPDSGYGLSPWVGPLSALGYNRGLASEGGYGWQSAPPAFAAARLTDALRRRGIAVTGAPGAAPAPSAARILAAVDSPPMARLATLTNKPSDNYFAEMLLKALSMRLTTPDPPSTDPRATPSARSAGDALPTTDTRVTSSARSASEDSPSRDSQAARGVLTRAPTTAAATKAQTLTRPQPRVIRRGTTAGGAKLAARFAKRLGAAPARLADGSGLSRLNRASPQRVVRLLLALRERAEWPAFARSLSIAGRDGTLGPRMRTGPARGRCRGKTGTLSGVSGVSGYCRARSGETYFFSILMNGTDAYRARSIQDGMLQAIAGVR